MATRRLIQSQQLVQQQKLLFNTSLLEIPILLIDKTLERVFDDPSVVESKLSELSKGQTNQAVTHHADNPSFYAYLLRFISSSQQIKESSHKLPDKIIVGESLKPGKAEPFFAYPDITYKVRGYGDFSIVPADHFKPSAAELKLLQLQKKVVPFARWLVNQKNWVVKTLEACYFAIGKV